MFLNNQGKEINFAYQTGKKIFKDSGLVGE